MNAWTAEVKEAAKAVYDQLMDEHFAPFIHKVTK
jgi:hypothetical protein